MTGVPDLVLDIVAITAIAAKDLLKIPSVIVQRSPPDVSDVADPSDAVCARVCVCVCVWLCVCFPDTSLVCADHNLTNLCSSSESSTNNCLCMMKDKWTLVESTLRRQKQSGIIVTESSHPDFYILAFFKRNNFSAITKLLNIIL